MAVTIQELGFAPGKGMAAYDAVPLLSIDNRGLFGDREYMFVEAEPHENVLYHRGEVAEPGHFLSMREDPLLSQVVPRHVVEGGVTLQTRDNSSTLYVPHVEDTEETRVPVSVWGWHGEAVDQGNDAAKWGADVIGRPVRLVAVSDESPRFVENKPELGRVGFADAYSFTVGSTESVALVNQRLEAAGRPPISHRRPRVTMLLDGLVLPNLEELPEGIFPEDFINEIKLTSNGLLAVFKRVKACGRCPVPDTNEITGERRGAPVRKALGELARNGRHRDTARYGSKPELFWTQNFVLQLPESMHPDQTIDVMRGAEVEVAYANFTNWI